MMMMMMKQDDDDEHEYEHDHESNKWLIYKEVYKKGKQEVLGAWYTGEAKAGLFVNALC